MLQFQRNSPKHLPVCQPNFQLDRGTPPVTSDTTTHKPPSRRKWCTARKFDISAKEPQRPLALWLAHAWAKKICAVSRRRPPQRDATARCRHLFIQPPRLTTVGPEDEELAALTGA